eukprot:844334-Rhodomonas_salina.1
MKTNWPLTAASHSASNTPEVAVAVTVHASTTSGKAAPCDGFAGSSGEKAASDWETTTLKFEAAPVLKNRTVPIRRSVSRSTRTYCGLESSLASAVLMQVSGSWSTA